MKKTITVALKDPALTLAAQIVYGQRKAWGELTYSPLHLSFMRPRSWDRGMNRPLPLIVWLCGGAFIEMDRNIWIPELVWFARRGYAVASVDYSTTYRSRYPENAVDIKLAIRYMRAHAAEFGIDPQRIAIMGESAGGYLSAFCALTGRDKGYDTGGYEDYSSEVQAAVPWYPPARMTEMDISPEKLIVPHDIANYADLTKLAKPGAPPFLILHGNRDGLVPLRQGELLYEALEKAQVPVDMYIIEGADHGDTAFLQTEVKELILEFLEKTIA
jgi:acetyl esterase/lipase